jgi:hypothetical protein
VQKGGKTPRSGCSRQFIEEILSVDSEGSAQVEAASMKERLDGRFQLVSLKQPRGIGSNQNPEAACDDDTVAFEQSPESEIVRQDQAAEIVRC